MEMMTGRTLFRNYKEYDQKEVEICGWVKASWIKEIRISGY